MSSFSSDRNDTAGFNLGVSAGCPFMSNGLGQCWHLLGNVREPGSVSCHKVEDVDTCLVVEGGVSADISAGIGIHSHQRTMLHGRSRSGLSEGIHVGSRPLPRTWLGGLLWTALPVGLKQVGAPHLLEALREAPLPARMEAAQRTVARLAVTQEQVVTHQRPAPVACDTHNEQRAGVASIGASSRNILC